MRRTNNKVLLLIAKCDVYFARMKANAHRVNELERDTYYCSKLIIKYKMLINKIEGKIK